MKKGPRPGEGARRLPQPRAVRGASRRRGPKLSPDLNYSQIRGNLVDFFFGFAFFFSKKRCKGIEKSQNSGLVQSRKCKARKTLKNDALDAKIGVDTAVNEHLKV